MDPRDLDDEPDAPAYWFRAKRYGWGWGLPTAWQGWVVLGVFVALAVGAGLIGERAPGLAVGIVVAASVLLLWVCWRKGEPPRWRWGGDR